MPSASGKAKNKAMLQAAKALAAAAASLGSAAEALKLLCEEEEDNKDGAAVQSGGPAPIGDHTSVAQALSKPPVTGYDSDDSEDDYMARAREEVRAAVAIMPPPEDPTPLESTPGLQSPGASEKPDLSVTLADIQARFAKKRGPSESSGLAFERRFSMTGQSEGWGSSRSRQHNEHATAGSTSSHFDIPISLNGETDNHLENNVNRTETPDREPFKNLKNRWLRPTKLQMEMFDSLRTEHDIMLYHGNMKSHAHAILVRCMEVFKEQPPRDDPTGIISALIIVPQQTTGRLYLNFANELFKDFDLPHKALLLPGGGSDVATEAERMASERIDILISSPRVFINHVNSNPSLRIHLAKLRFLIFAGAHELTQTDVFLNFQLNTIKKRMPTRAKSPRQVIITSPSISDSIQTFATRALSPSSDFIVSSDLDDELQEESWEDQAGWMYITGRNKH